MMFSQQFNFLPPSIEPTAPAILWSKLSLPTQLLEKGLAYEVNGSVYFDVAKYNENHDYGYLSGRNVEELMAGHTGSSTGRKKNATT